MPPELGQPAAFRLDVGKPRHRRPELLIKDDSVVRRMAATAWAEADALTAAGEYAAARGRYERAHRVAPSDQNLRFALAGARLADGDPAAALPLFERIARAEGLREAWMGLAACALACQRRALALEAAQAALSRNTITPTLADLAGKIVPLTGQAGWCGVGFEGVVVTDVPAAKLSVTLDGNRVRLDKDGRLPPAWRQAVELRVRADGRDLLGSPILPSHILRLEGFVTRQDDQLTGWAWYPRAPEIDPELRLLDAACVARHVFVAKDLSVATDGSVTLARRRGFVIPAWGDGPNRVVGPSGADLLGSPVWATQTMVAGPSAAFCGTGRRAPRAAPRAGAVDVVIPVYRGLAETRACLESVLAALPDRSRLWVVNDASPEPALVAFLRGLAAARRIRLIDSAPDGHNIGFPGAANAGLRRAAGRDVVLLNSDTLVPPTWLEPLRDAAYSAPDIGTATPFSNDASILSYPRVGGGNPMPGLAQTRELAALAARVNAGRLVELPTANGFCMFIRRDCLAATGLLREDVFAQGYGEENDFTERARSLGYRHVAVPGVFVAHAGNTSFGGARADLLARNLATLDRLHPAYLPRVAAYIDADPLFPARRRLDAARWAGLSRPAGAVLLVTHGAGGGTGRIIEGRIREIQAGGRRPIVLRARDFWCELDDGSGNFPNLRYVLPAEMPALLRVLRAERPVAGELHHLLGHDHAIVSLFARLRIPYDSWVHDYALLCPRITLVNGAGQYCGEPPVAVCEVCVREAGTELEEPITPTALRARSASDLAGAARVIVPSEDVARRIARHFTGIAPVIQPWESDTDFAPRAAPAAPRRRVAVIGAIGIDKGFNLLLACAQDAAARRLALEFVVVGYTIGDEALEATGHALVIGEFAPTEVPGLITAQAASLAFLPSIWPESWCYALSDAWAAGLAAVVLDIGTPAARVRATGRGWVLPLGLPPAGINDALLRFQVTLSSPG